LNLDPDEKKVMELLQSRQQVHVDEFCSALQMPVSRISALLLNLEFSNVIKSQPGKMYTLC